jgi:phage tail-like protein
MNQSPTVAVTRRDPLRTFQFRLKLMTGPNTDYIAGVRSVSGLSWTMSVHETWSGGNNYHRYANPNRITWEPITLEQGVALDTTLEAWAEAARDLHQGGAASAVKRNLTIDVWDRTALGAEPTGAAHPILQSYIIRNAWVSKYVALPKLDAMSSEVALLSVEIVHEGWQRQEKTAKRTGTT